VKPSKNSTEPKLLFAVRWLPSKAAEAESGQVEWQQIAVRRVPL
jgi:hypothetical protein